MPDLVIVPAEVIPQSEPVRLERVVAPGLSITAGKLLFIDSNDQWQIAYASGTVEQANATHLALNNAADGQLLTGALLDDLLVTLGAGAAPVQAVGYWLSPTVSGNHALEADLLTGHYGTFLGIGLSNNQILYNKIASNQVRL